MAALSPGHKSFWPKWQWMAIPVASPVALFLFIPSDFPGRTLFVVVMSVLLGVMLFACLQRIVITEAGISIRSLVPLVWPQNLAWDAINSVHMTDRPRRMIKIEVEGRASPYCVREDFIQSFDLLYRSLQTGSGSSSAQVD